MFSGELKGNKFEGKFFKTLFSLKSLQRNRQVSNEYSYCYYVLTLI
jgi:hypothetical protein